MSGLLSGVVALTVLGLVRFYSKTGTILQMSWRLLRRPSILSLLGLLDHSQIVTTYPLNIGSHTRVPVIQALWLLRKLPFLRLQMLSLLDGIMLRVLGPLWALPQLLPKSLLC